MKSLGLWHSPRLPEVMLCWSRRRQRCIHIAMRARCTDSRHRIQNPRLAFPEFDPRNSESPVRGVATRQGQDCLGLRSGSPGCRAVWRREGGAVRLWSLKQHWKVIHSLSRIAHRRIHLRPLTRESPASLQGRITPDWGCRKVQGPHATKSGPVPYQPGLVVYMRTRPQSREVGAENPLLLLAPSVRP